MSFAGSNQEIRIDLTGQDNLTPMLRGAADSLAVFTGNAERTLSALARFGQQAAPILAVGAAFGVMGAQAMAVQQNVANLNAVLQATPNQLAAIRAQGLQLAQVTQFTDSQILQSQVQLAKGRQTPTQIRMETPQVLNLAGATSTSPTQAATSFISAQKAFQLGSDQTTDTVNTLSEAVNTSLESMQNFSAGLKNVAPVAQGTGISLRDTSTALAELSQAGLQGAQGGTALRTFLQHIQKETPQARAEIQALGLSFYDSAGQMRSLPDIMDQLRQKMAGLTDEARGDALTKIFGTRGALAADVFAEQGGGGFYSQADAMNADGTAAEMNAKKLDTLQGSLSKLGSSINTLEVQGGNILLPFFKGAADGAELLTNKLTDLNANFGIIPQMIVAAGALGGLSRLDTILTNRKSDRAQSAADDLAKSLLPQQRQAAADEAAMQGYMERENTRYQQELSSYEAYQAKLSSYQDQEMARRAEVDAKIEEIEVAHQERLAEIQRQAAAAPPAAAPQAAYEAEIATAAEQAAYQKKMSAAPTYTPRAAPTPVESPTPIAMPIIADEQVAAGTVALDAGFIAASKAKIAPLVSKAGAALGPIAMGILVAATVKEMVINPIEKAVYDHASKSDPKLQKINVETSIALNPTDMDTSQQKAFLAKAQDDIKQMIQYQQGEVDKYTPKSIPGKILTAIGGDDKNLGQAKETLSSLNDDLTTIQAKIRDLDTQQKQSVSDEQSNAATDVANIVAKYQNGAESIEDAKKELYQTAIQDLSALDANGAPLSNADFQKKIDAIVNPAIQQLVQTQAAQKTQAIQDAQTYADNMDQAAKAATAGASDDDILMGIFGVGPNGEDITAKQVQQAKKHITDLEQAETQAASAVTAAWTEAGTAVGKIDPAKGIESLVAAADNMKSAGDELARLGLSNTQFSELNAIAQSFKDIADAEDRATTAFNGYLMEFNQTDSSMSKLSNLQKQFVQAQKDAIAAQASGTATESQKQLLANAPNIAAYLRQQQSGLSANEAQSFLGMMQNAPDFLSVDNAYRQNVTTLGGPQTLYQKLQLDTVDAEAAIKLLLDDKHMKVYVDWQYPNGGPDILTANQQYGNATNDSGYNDQPPAGSSDSPTSVTSLEQRGVASDLSYTPNGFNQFRSLDQKSYTSIVEGAAGGTGTPFDDPAMYAAVMAAAKEYGVDPRALLAFTKNENNDATNISPELNAANNFAGIKYVGQKNASDSGIVSPEGDDYAKFADPTDFFRTLAANMSTGQYQDMYNRGDLGAVRREYVVGGAGPGTPEQEQNIANTVSDYQAYLNKYPGTVLGGGQAGAGSSGAATDAVAAQVFAATKEHLGDPDVLVQGVMRPAAGWCDAFVENMVQQATGINSRFSTADEQIKQALAGNKSAGTPILASEAQPGDLIGWQGGTSGAGGGSEGHIGIYAGGNQYISALSGGVQQNGIPDLKDAVFLRPPGSSQQGYLPHSGTYGQSEHGQTYGPLGTPGSAGTNYNPYYFSSVNATGTNPNTTPYVDPTHYSDVQAGMASLDTFFRKMAAPDVGRVISQMGTDSSYFKNVYTRGVDPTNIGAMNNATDTANAANLNFAAAKARAMFDALDPTKTEQFSNDLKTVAATGGEIGQNAVQWLQAQQQINAATRENVQLQDQMKSATEQATQRQRDRQDQDLLTAANNLKRDRAIQDYNQTMQYAFQSQQRQIQADTNAEDIKYTGISRAEQDKQRALQFSQQVQATDLQNQLADTQKAQQEQIWQRTAAEQLVAANVKAAPNNAAAAASAAQLAGLHDQDLLQKDINTKTIDNLETQIREEAKKANLDSYNLATETLQAQRAHEDAMQRINERSQQLAINEQNESNREQHQAEVNQRADQDAAIRLAAIRLSQDRALEDWQKGAQKEIDLNNGRIKTAQDEQGALDSLLNVAISGMNEFGTSALGIVNSLNIAVGNKPIQSPNIGTSSAIRRLGGHYMGGTIPSNEMLSLVGEGPGGQILPSTEIISAPGSTVTPMALLARLGVGQKSSGGISIGISAPITVTQPENPADIEATVEAAVAPIKAQLREALTRNSNYMTSVGINRIGRL